MKVFLFGDLPPADVVLSKLQQSKQPSRASPEQLQQLLAASAGELGSERVSS